MASSAMDAAAAAEVGVLLNVNAGPGAGSAAIGHVADSFTSSAGQSFSAPVAGSYLGTDDALVPMMAIAMRWGGVARLGGLVAALMLVIPVSTVVALGIIPVVFVLRNAEVPVVVPFPITRAAFAVRRRRVVVRAASREAEVTSPVAMVLELGLGAVVIVVVVVVVCGDCEGKEGNKSERQELHSE